MGGCRVIAATVGVGAVGGCHVIIATPTLLSVALLVVVATGVHVLIPAVGRKLATTTTTLPLGCHLFDVVQDAVDASQE